MFQRNLVKNWHEKKGASKNLAQKSVIVTDTKSGKAMTTPKPHERHVRVLLSPLLNQNIENFAVGFTEVPPFTNGTRHQHSESEIWMVISGTAIARVGTEEYQIASGSVVYTPAGTSHQFVNESSESVCIFFVYVPSGAERSIISGEFL